MQSEHDQSSARARSVSVPASVPTRAGAQPFLVEVHTERDAVRVTPAGELDVATVGHVAEQLCELHATGVRRFLLDLSELTFLDSTGLHLVLTWERYANEDGIDFAIIEGPPAVQRAFAASGLRDQLPFRAK